MLKKMAILTGLICCTSYLAGQCLSYKNNSLFIVDRYTDAAEYRGYLILMNGSGLVFKKTADLNGPADFVEPVPGNAIALQVFGDRLLVTVEGEGIHAYDFNTEDNAGPLLKKHHFFAIPRIKQAFATDQYLVALLEDKVRLFKLSARRIDLVSEWAATGTKILANQNLVFLHLSNNRIAVRAFTEQGFLGEGREINLLGEVIFYDLHLRGDALLVETLSGMKWVRFSPAGDLIGVGTLFDNSGQNVVLGSALAENYIYLRFSERLDVYALGFGMLASAVATLPLSFAEGGHTKIVPVGDNLHLLNLRTTDREWSVITYRVNDNQPLLLARQDAVYNEVTGAVAIGDRYFMAAGQWLFDGNGVALAGNSGGLTPLLQLDDNILKLAATDSAIFFTIPGTAAGYTRLYRIIPAADGSMPMENLGEYRGTLDAFSQFGDTLCFLQYVRRSNGEYFTINLLRQDAGGSITSRTLERILPIQSPNPFIDLQVGDLGLAYHNSQGVTLHSDLNDLTQQIQVLPPIPEGIEKLVLHQGAVWVETQKGLSVLRLEGNSLVEIGTYPHLVKLQRLANNQVLARSIKDQQPSRYHLLSLEPAGFVNARVSFDTSTLPLLVSQHGDEVMVTETSSLSVFQVDCPETTLNYLIPYVRGLELELNTVVKQGELITMTIFDEANEVIGIQNLDAEIIDAMNGNFLEDWLFEFNHLETPFSFLLSANQPMTPIVSGNSSPSLSSRFAYLVPPWHGSQVFVSHIPKNSDFWSTEIYLRNYDSVVPVIKLEAPTGEELAQNVSPGGTDIINNLGGLFSGPAPWVSISSENLSTLLSGFSLYQEQSQLQSAAIPLVPQLSEFLILPHILGQTRPNWWTGLVLANVAREPVTVRVLGYGHDGGILLDRTAMIPGSDSLVVVAEDWLRDIRKANQVQWLAIVAEYPIMGMVLYGDWIEGRLGGIPLTSDYGNQLWFAGIRANDTWWTDLYVTNIDGRDSTLDFLAYNGKGEVLTQVRKFIGSKGVYQTSVVDLFREMDPADLSEIHSIRVQSPDNVIGFMFRGIKGTSSLEAVRAWPETSP